VLRLRMRGVRPTCDFMARFEYIEILPLMLFYLFIYFHGLGLHYPQG